VLFVCRSNAAWSILAEALLNRLGRSVFFAMSAGVEPAQNVSPLAVQQLVATQLPLGTCFTKSIDGFRGDSNINLDFIFSSVDLEALGLSRGWPGHPIIGHWRIPDPLETPGRENAQRNQIRSTFGLLQSRIGMLVALPPEKLVNLAAHGSEESITWESLNTGNARVSAF
jgi:arsenate reductase